MDFRSTYQNNERVHRIPNTYIMLTYIVLVETKTSTVDDRIMLYM